MTITLNAEKREIFGKALADVRAAGKMPVVLYGAKNPAISLVVDLGEFKKVLRSAGESTIVSVTTPTGKKDVLIHDVAHDPMTGEPIHADLLAVDVSKPIQVDVPLEFVGEAPALKLGGTLVKVLHEIEVEALPKDLPHSITVDVSALIAMDSKITIGDLSLPTGVTTELPADEVVASITEAGEEVNEEEAPVDLSSIEVEKKGKAEEESTEE